MAYGTGKSRIVGTSTGNTGKPYGVRQDYSSMTPSGRSTSSTSKNSVSAGPGLGMRRETSTYSSRQDTNRFVRNIHAHHPFRKRAAFDVEGATSSNGPSRTRTAAPSNRSGTATAGKKAAQVRAPRNRDNVRTENMQMQGKGGLSILSEKMRRRP